MQTTFKTQLRRFCLLAACAGWIHTGASQDAIVSPARGGGLDTNQPMIHVDIFYDYAANEMQATLDTSKGVPKLQPLPSGYAFDARSNYAVLTGKAYNFQLAWNPGGIFAPPPGAAVWIERLNFSPGLENYDGPGNKMENPPRPYSRIFETNGSKWKWYGRMSHNAYAVLHPATNLLTAEFKIYFGDALTGSREAFAGYDDATITLTLTADAPDLPAYLTPKMGGGQASADMAHIDISYDDDAKQIHAHVDDSYGTPELRALAPGEAFDPQQPYAVLNGKAYNSQYGWNAGGFFTIPEGAAIWIEQTDCSPGLEVYQDWGRLGSYAPIFGTAGSPRLWQWSGVMAHNSYAVLGSVTDRWFADYRIFFGDAITGSRAGFAQYGDTTVRLEWTTVPEPPSLRFGAAAQTNAAPLVFLNGGQLVTNTSFIVNLHSTNSGPWAGQYERCLPMEVVPATLAHGGPYPNAAAAGSCVELRFASLTGPPGASLSFWEPGVPQPRFRMPVGEVAGQNRIRLSENEGEPNADPYGNIPGRRLTVDQPGLYCLAFQVVDTSTNGPSGSPIHAASELYRAYLQAGLTINSLAKQGTTIKASFGGEPGASYYLERATFLEHQTPWQTIAGPLEGTSRIQELTDSAATGTQTFYRLRSQRP